MIKMQSKIKAKEITKYWKINMMEDRPGAIGFTSGFSQEHKYYDGQTNYCRAIDRIEHSYENI